MAQDHKTSIGLATSDGELSGPATGDAEAKPAQTLSMSLADQAPGKDKPPPLPFRGSAASQPDEPAKATTNSPATLEDEKKDDQSPAADRSLSLDLQDDPPRRLARRRPAGPVRGRVAANDDAPSIGGLIYALEQRPSNKPFLYAVIASAVWAIAGLSFSAVMLTHDFNQGLALFEILAKPTSFFALSAVVVPIVVVWFLALLAWRTEELRLRSSTMTEVAVRLAEPDRLAEQSVTSLGQAVRRQVSFMNDAVSRALGRAGELEALVHNEVTALERSYEENERKIRSLIQELTGERNALVNTSDRVTGTLRQLGSEVPTLIEKLSHQQIRLAQIIQQAGDNLTSLETSVGKNVDKLESSLGTRTEEFQNLLEGYTTGLAEALGSRGEQMKEAFNTYLSSLDASLGERTDRLQTVFNEYAQALDTTLANRAQVLDMQLVERTKTLDHAFNERLRLFDQSILKSTRAIDSAVGEKAAALTTALDVHARTFSETITRQSSELDESLMRGIHAVRRTSENITRQSLKAIEGLASQSDLLKNVSENLLGQINTVTGRFENQSQSIMKAANSLESANYKIDVTLQSRHSELADTLSRLSGKADEFGRFIEGYSSTIEGSLGDAERRARQVTEQLLIGTEERKSEAMAGLERMRQETGKQRDQVIAELRQEFASVSNAINDELGKLRSRFDQTSEEVRQRAAKVAADIAAEQTRLRQEMDRLPTATREGTEAVRRALQDQLRALRHLTELTSQTARHHDVRPPYSGAGGATLTRTYEQATARNTPQQRGLSRLATSAGPGSMAVVPGAPPSPPPLQPPGGAQRGSAPQPGADSRETWSLGDLLARASREEDANAPSSRGVDGSGDGALHLDIGIMVHALDAATAAAIWTRLLSGQANIMARSMYSQEAQAVFDQIRRRLQGDPTLQETIDRFLADFDRIRRDAEQKDPGGGLARTQLISDTGRVYLFLAHASGRIT